MPLWSAHRTVKSGAAAWALTTVVGLPVLLASVWWGAPWFTILVAVTLQTSFLSPPVGFALFYLKGVCPPEVTVGDIYRGVVPFIILQLVGLAIFIIWPSLVTWLPAASYG